MEDQRWSWYLLSHPIFSHGDFPPSLKIVLSNFPQYSFPTMVDGQGEGQLEEIYKFVGGTLRSLAIEATKVS